MKKDAVNQMETTQVKKPFYKKWWIWIILLVIIISIGLAAWYYQIKLPHDTAVSEYNSSVEYVNGKNSELDMVIDSAKNVINSGSNPYDIGTITNVEYAIAEAQNARREIPENVPSATDEIISKAKELKKDLDYSLVMTNIEENVIALENSIRQLEQITNPAESFVIERLKEIDGVEDLQAVTEDNDPNGNLNKAGGYTSTVYFTHSLVDKDSPEVIGDTVVEKGTLGGGAIEVYANEDDANKRNDYLSEFDGTLFNSGSHVVIGTIVIRTSDLLTASQQNELTEQIKAKMIELR